MPDTIKRVTDLSELTELDADELFIAGYNSSATLKKVTFATIKNTIMATVNDAISSALVQNNKTILPVGTIIQTTNSANPSTYISGTTWEAYGAGRVLVAINGSETEFNSIGKTGGNKNMQAHVHSAPVHSHSIPAHLHSIAAHVHSIAAHTHTFSLTTASGGGHNHRVSHNREKIFGNTVTGKRLIGYNSEGAAEGSYTDSYTQSVGGHTHTGSGTTANGGGGNTGSGGPTQTGSGGSGNTGNNAAANTGSYGSGNAQNLQPYIVVYRWRRTA